MIFVLAISFMIALTGFILNRNHLISALLCLETMMLVIFLTLALWPPNLSPSMLMSPLILLTISACEAALALSLLIALVRAHGNDKLKSLKLLRC
uniref:NADH-ubiquinone oxidoreductase chain 4L n=1 Tax=Xenorhina sp. TNHC-GDC 31177 TaxID=1933077 RepID=A0A343VTH6_9NEOB|nr:NADH dehydrogenase subunit 4L [Xenorhina sp. TNHC-GDC 31177]